MRRHSFCREGVIANFDVVSGLKRHLHRVITLVHWSPAGTRALVFAWDSSLVAWILERLAASACLNGRDTSPRCK